MSKYIKSNGKTKTTYTGKIDNTSLVFSGYDPYTISCMKAGIIHMSENGRMVQTKTSRNGYRRNYKLEEDKFDDRILVSIMPVKPNAAPLRLEFNPANLGHENGLICWGMVCRSELLT